MTKIATPLVQPDAIDLQSPGSEVWSCVVVPRGWEPVAEICRRVAGGLESFTSLVVDKVADEVPYYTRLGVPREDIYASVFRNLEMILLGLAEHRGPSREELEVRRALGRRRAHQGIPADAILQAYHVGYRELWLTLIEEAKTEPPEVSTLLLGAATTVWEWIHRVTDVVAEAYQETVGAREAQAGGRRQRLIELIVSGDVEGEEVLELAMSFGLEPERTFRALAILANESDALARIQSVLAPGHGRFVCAAQGRTTVVVCQGERIDETVDAIRRGISSALIGVGLARTGLAGARYSVGDAERALALAERRGEATSFDRDWLFATLLQAHDRLREILSPGIGIGAKHPHLVDAVRAFAESGFSIAETARRLRLHPNTVGYRLERWRVLTGWDPQTLDGVMRSLASLEIAAGDDHRV